ncbi:MAG: UDP-N-acetylmuramoyl-L-alanyl-D-glutamate--2,6-diaminopimelate ligase [Clostridia bacterium]|nr:UDP-N-acetylmuramoyl-L-alanyl-D-glutamate--2,6-diaminopimelate ligase [Clostridia bacterium]
MKLSSLLKGVKTQDVYEERDVERVTDKDNGNLKNALFICVDGNRCDGHSLAEKVLKCGAAAVVTDRDLGLSGQIIVDDTRAAYAQISANFYDNPSKKLKIIGVTGTNGKTSTAFFIKEILASLGHSCGIIGTIKNAWENTEREAVLTTPEPPELHKLLSEMVKSGCEYCVMEVSSQALSQKRVYGIDFCAAALTNITPEHLDYHGNMENYIAAKLQLFRNSGFACVNVDDENILNNIEKIDCKAYTYSIFKDSADYTAKNIVCNEKGIKYELVGIDCIARIQSEINGKFNVYNTLCAASVLINLGFDLDDIAKAIGTLDSVKGRCEIVPTDRNFTVIIDYAHTPDGLQNILSAVRETAKGRVILVFGCGGDRDKSKRREMGRIAGELSDFAVVTSDNPRTENPLLIINDILFGMEKAKSGIAVIENRTQAIGFALSKARKGDTVILAGKGHENYQIIGNEKLPFDERKIVQEKINEIKINRCCKSIGNKP